MKTENKLDSEISKILERLSTTYFFSHFLFFDAHGSQTDLIHEKDAEKAFHSAGFLISPMRVRM